MIAMTQEIVNDVQKELEESEIEHLEDLCEWWIDYNYCENAWETVTEYENRKSVVIPMIIGEKLKHYEQEYE